MGARREGVVRSERRRRCFVVAIKEGRGGVRTVLEEVAAEGGMRIGVRNVVEGWGHESMVKCVRSWV